MSKLQEVKGIYTINVPKLYVKKKKWRKGQELLWSFDQDGNLVLMDSD